MKTDDFDYILPPEQIAQTPAEPRDSSRLLVLDRARQTLEQHIFRDVEDYLRPGDVLVANQTRVIPARLAGQKLPGGGKVEILLLKRLSADTWEALAGGRGFNVGRRLQITGGPQAEVIEVLDGPRRIIRFDQPPELFVDQVGQMPLPPYIHTPLANPERYQTVYAAQPGSAAAPTAGLHFTPQLIERLRAKGVHFATVTLHVGLDTFQPVSEDAPEEHHIHTEWCQVTPPPLPSSTRPARPVGGWLRLAPPVCARSNRLQRRKVCGPMKAPPGCISCRATSLRLWMPSLPIFTCRAPP